MGKALLISMTVAVAGVMAFVHYQQVDERKRMHKGVERELERMKAKKEGN